MTESRHRVRLSVMAKAIPAMTAEQLQTLLDRHGVSQQELARRLGVDGQTVHRWCSGTHKINKMKATAIRLALSK